MRPDVVKQREQNAVYRICAVGDERWDVLQDDAASNPLASFTNKHAALAYAMRLARDSSGRGVPVERRTEALRALFDSRGPQG